MFNTNLKMSLLVILWHLHWLHWCHRSLLFWNGKSWYPCFLQFHLGSITSMVFGVAFSLIVIMLQTKFLLVRVHSPVVSIFLHRKFLTCEHINNLILKSWGVKSTESEWKRSCVWNRNSYNFQKFCVYFAELETLLPIEQCLFTKS